MNTTMTSGAIIRISQLLLLITALALFYRGWPTSDPLPKDFAVYSIALERFRQGLSPYDPHIVMTFKYSPGFFSILQAIWPPIGSSSSHVAWWSFKAFSLGLWWIAMVFTFPVRTGKEFLALLIGLAFCWKGLIETLDFGQLEYVLFSLTFLAAYKMPKSAFVAGLFSGLLPWLKLPFVLVPIVLFLHSASKKYFSLGVILTASLMGVLLPLAAFGQRFFAMYRDWFETLANQSSEILIQEPANQSLLATLSRSGLPPTIATLLCAALLLIYLIHEMKISKNDFRIPSNSHRELPTRVLALLLLVNPLSWRWSLFFVLDIPRILMEKPRRFKTVASLLLLLFWFVQLNPIAKTLGFPRWTDLFPYGVITLTWIVCLLTVWRPSAKN